jgi:cellulose synthase/poly-beta-1,6-N-acetylglucosamine synthase-like glycosyltransferase
LKTLFLTFYFFLLFYIALYGVHLYWLIFLYWKHRREVIVRKCSGPDYPIVTVQLPIYNERLVARRLVQAVAAFDWPKDRLEIQILDDSTDDTTDILAQEVARLRACGYSINHLRREIRNGYKAGALQDGLRRSRGEYIAIFDADNIPRPDFLKETVSCFTSPDLALVQARWGFLNRGTSLLCRAQALFLDAHFFIEQSARSRGGLCMNFNGTAGVWRKQAIIDAGGWRFDTLTEDLDLSYRVQMRGWRMILADDVVVPTELPAAIRSFKSQQYRWARGAIETARLILPCLHASQLSARQKIAATFHLTQKTVSVALLLLSLLLIPALFLRTEGGMIRLLFLDIPIFLAGTGSMSIFYGLAYGHVRIRRSVRDILVLSTLTSVGIALSLNNALAVLFGLFSRSRVFIRTPKSGAIGVDQMAIPQDYRLAFDHTILGEFGLALYSTAAILAALIMKIFFSIPFLMTFAFGFAYFAWLSYHERDIQSSKTV